MRRNTIHRLLPASLSLYLSLFVCPSVYTRVLVRYSRVAQGPDQLFTRRFIHTPHTTPTPNTAFLPFQTCRQQILGM